MRCTRGCLLLLIMKIKFINKVTGELFEIDKDALKFKRRATMRRKIVEQAMEKGLCYLLTLTLNDRKIPMAVCRICFLHRVWDRFLKRLRRKAASISFVTIVEESRRSVHLHVLMNEAAAVQWIKRAWLECGGGIIIYLDVIKAEHIKTVAYYITKALLRSKTAGRLVTTSQDIDLTAPALSGGEEPSDWIVLTSPPRGGDDEETEKKCIHGYSIAALEEFLRRLMKLFEADDGLELYDDLSVTTVDQNILQREFVLIPRLPAK